MTVRSNILALILLVLTVSFLSGCSAEKEKDITATEVEMFAKAQELQKQEKYLDAIEIYRKIIREFPETRQGANSQFMIGYIYANHVKDYEQAKLELNRFLEKFSEVADSGLVAGAKFELDHLGKDIDQIPILSGISGEDSAVSGADNSPEKDQSE